MAVGIDCRTLTSAWIETFNFRESRITSPVALSRVRGLKLMLSMTTCRSGIVALSRVRGLKLHQKADVESMPDVALSRVRGLKLLRKERRKKRRRRTLTSAWIETVLFLEICNDCKCRTLTSAWIET